MLRPWQQESCTRRARVRTGLLAGILPNDNAAAPLMARRRNGRGQRLGIVKEETRFTQRHASQIKHITHEYPSCLGIDVTDLFAVIVSKQRSASESRRACSDSAHEMQSRNTQVHTRQKFSLRGHLPNDQWRKQDVQATHANHRRLANCPLPR